MSAQTFMSKVGNNNNSKIIKPQIRPFSAAPQRNKLIPDNEFGIRLEEAKKTHYEFDPLKNTKEFSAIQGIFFTIIIFLDKVYKKRKQ